MSSNGKFAINKKPDMTYVSKPDGKNNNIRYISKVFELKDFKDFYYDRKEKKVFEVIRETSTQEVTAIYDSNTNGFSVRIQRFSKESGIPQNQSFSFHGGALTRFIKFLDSIGFLNLKLKQNLKFSDEEVDQIIEKKKVLSQLIENATFISTDHIFQLIDRLKQQDKNALLGEIINNIEQYEIENINAAIKQKKYKKELKMLEKLLEIEQEEDFLSLVLSDPELCKYKAKQPEKVFHKWIENNIWIFGVEYQKKHLFSKIGEDDSKADIVLETADGFLSLIEVKRPIPKYKLLKYDKSHRSYFPSTDFSEAIGQCLIYLQRIEDFKKTIENEYSVRILRPRIRLIIGRTKEFEIKENEALHFINSSLQDIDVISYDQLLENGKRIISFYEK